MFTPEIVNFFENRGFPCIIGTCDNAHKPAIARVFGLKMENENSLAVLLPEIFAEQSLSNLQQNKRVAITQANPQTSNSYQFKGEYISHSPCTPEELAFLGENYTAFKEMIKHGYGPEAADEFSKRSVGDKFISIKVKVDEVFNQTPGPGAGKKVN